MAEKLFFLLSLDQARFSSCDNNLVLEIRLSCQSAAETHKLANVLWHSVSNNPRHIRAGPVERMLCPTSNPWQPVQPAVIIRSRLSITRRVTGCWTDEGLLQGALPGSPSSLAPQELAAVSDIQGRSPLTDLSPRERLWALRHRATLSSRLARPQGAQLGRGSPGLLGTVTQASGVNNRSPSSGSGCLSAAFFVQKYTCNTSRRVLLAVVHPSPRLQRRNLVLPSASHACSLAGRDSSCTTGQFRSPTPPPLALRLFLCYVGLNHGQYLRPSKHNAA